MRIKLRILGLTVLLFLASPTIVSQVSADDFPSLQQSKRRIGKEDEDRKKEALRSAWERLTNQERAASQLVVGLDTGIALLRTGMRNALGLQREDKPLLALQARVGSFLQKERVLLSTDHAINTELGTLYREAAALESAERSESLVRIALLHWTVLLRRASMQGFHTAVAGLVDDPDCAGDIIGDQLLQRYFDALFDRGEKRPVEVVIGLAALARQSACLGTHQSALLASNLYSSYAELRAFLRLNGLYDVVPYVAQAASQPLVLIYDVEKWRGPQSPLARWFTENREFLVQGVVARRHPVTWHGLWLYDRRSGRVLGYQQSDNPRDENEVDLTRFWASITSLENLGEYTCSFAEMVERGADLLGYFCAGSSCRQQTSEGAARAEASRGERQPLRIEIGRELQQTACQQSSPGRDGRGGSVCSQGLNIAGGSRAAGAVRCLTEQVVRPGTETFTCMAEAMGMCSSPVERLAKALRKTQFSGVKVGSRCQIAEGTSTRDDKIAEARQKYAEKHNWLQEVMHDAVETLKEKQQERDRVFDNPDSTEQERDDAQHEVDQQEEYINQLQSAIPETEQAAAEERDKAIKAGEEENQASTSGSGGSDAGGAGQRCPPDTPECGNNDCSAMSEAMRQTLECVKQALNPETRDPYRPQPGGCDPRTCDPIDPDPSPRASALWRCFSPMEEGVEAAVSKQCWAVDCIRGEQTVLTTSGLCGCKSPMAGTPGEGRLGSMCDTVDCAEGLPTWGPFGCTCSPSEGTSGGVAPPPGPRGAFNIKEPRTFSAVNPRAGVGAPPGQPPGPASPP